MSDSDRRKSLELLAEEIERKIEKAYDDGYADGFKDAEEKQPELQVEDAMARLNYLLKGGKWGVVHGNNAYASGYRDALLTLGLEGIE